MNRLRLVDKFLFIGSIMNSILFDLDGTLTDPAAGITRCISHALSELGRASPDLAALEQYIGPDLRGTFRTLLGGNEEVEAAIVLYRERFTRTGMFENEVYEGMIDCLETLQSQGCRLFVVTSKPGVFANEIVAHFGLARFFENVYSASLDGALSEKSDLIRLALIEEGMAPDDVVMIGDRRHDIAGARDNNVRSIGALWGYGSAAELRRAGADRLCDSPRSLARAIRSLRAAGVRCTGR